MCGIVGILGSGDVAPRILDALRRLEYRGYDSAGVATLEEGKLDRRRAEGKLANLADRLAAEPLPGRTGIGHTRWATHGAPTEENAHPHATEHVALVHNGIIENFRELREEVEAAGRAVATDTDTEIIAQLISVEVAAGSSASDAFKAVLAKLQGAFALAVIVPGDDDIMLVARRGSPLAIGRSGGEAFIGSDAIALAPFTNKVTYLDEGDWAILTRESTAIFDEHNRPVERAVIATPASGMLVDKGNHRHFMAKEIAEQPEVVGHTLAHYLDFNTSKVSLPDSDAFDFASLDRLSITACGTAYYAALVAKYWFERLARMPVDVDIASEFRYREMPLKPGGAAIVISQSGETADTLASLRYSRSAGQQIGAIVNVHQSTIARESDVLLPTLAGPEIGVASTKAFTCQLAVLASLAVAAGRARGVLSEGDEDRLVQALAEVPRMMTAALKLEHELELLAPKIGGVSHVLYLGRGTNYPLALEAALKLKEISYIHAEGYAAGELKHGPIALVDSAIPVIVIAPYDRIFAKTVSNMQEVAARGGQIILITDEKGQEAAPGNTLGTIVLPEMPATITPMVYALPVQLLAYHTAVFMGTDVDQPRNLAKSVTVE